MTFEHRVTLSSILTNSIVIVVLFLYSVVSTQLPPHFLKHEISYVISLFILMQIIIAPILHHIYYRELSLTLKTYTKENTNAKQRTKLLTQLMRQPSNFTIIVTLIYAATATVLFYIAYVKIHIQDRSLFLMYGEWLCGSYFAGLISRNVMAAICKPYAIKLVKDGVDSTFVHGKKLLGTSIAKQLVMFILIPLGLTTIINTSVIISGLYPFTTPMFRPGENFQMRCVFSTVGANAVIMLLLIIIFFLNQFFKNFGTSHTLEQILYDETVPEDALITDLDDELAYNMYLINEMIQILTQTITSVSDIGNRIRNASDELIHISSETESTAVEQSTATREIASTINENTQLSSTIVAKTDEVSSLANKTAMDVEAGSGTLRETIETMQNIKKANESTIQGIHALGARIASVWDIIALINSIADQTKIIAFNTELEATSAEDEEKNFRNVAAEIRRLANNIVESTTDIKKCIGQILTSNDALLYSSASNNEQIEQGMVLSQKLDEKFAAITESSVQNSHACQEITNVIKQQTEAFSQIQYAIHEINKSIQDFSESARLLTNTSSQLKSNADTLGTIVGGNK